MLVAGLNRFRNAESATSVVLFAAIVALCIYFTSQTDRFLTFGNMQVMVANYSVIAVVTVGMALLMISGPVDLSVGSTVGATGTLMALMIHDYGWSAPAGMAFAVLLGAAIGAMNGSLVSLLDFNPVIVTLGTQLLIRGALQLTRDTPVFEIGPTFRVIGADEWFGLPVQGWMALVVLLLAGMFLKMTPWGRYVYAIGINREAAYLSALPVRRLPFLLYVNAGALAGLAGLMLASRLNGASPGDQGVGFELQALTAVLLGGVAWAGGRGRLSGVFLALVFLAVLENGLVLLNVSPFVQLVVRGLALVVAAGLDTASTKLTGRIRFRQRTAGRSGPAVADAEPATELVP